MSDSSPDRVPYVLHFEGRTVVLGEPAHLEELDVLLRGAGAETRPTYWHGMRAEDPGAVVNSMGTDLARYRLGFDRLTAYFGPDDRIGCLRLPVICREPLEDELIARGTDVEPRFWE